MPNFPNFKLNFGMLPTKKKGYLMENILLRLHELICRIFIHSGHNPKAGGLFCIKKVESKVSLR